MLLLELVELYCNKSKENLEINSSFTKLKKLRPCCSIIHSLSACWKYTIVYDIKPTPSITAIINLSVWGFLRFSHRKCSIKQVFLYILKNSLENTCVGVSFVTKLQFCNVFKKTFFTEHLWKNGLTSLNCKILCNCYIFPSLSFSSYFTLLLRQGIVHGRLMLWLPCSPKQMDRFKQMSTEIS